jgi:hypothetical protein
VAWQDLRAIDRLHALDELLHSQAWDYFTRSAERAYAELTISGRTPDEREDARRFCLVVRDLRRRVEDERRAAREGLAVDEPRDDT